MMKRIVTMAAAAFFLAAMTSPSLAHKTKRKHSHKKPVATQPAENAETGKAMQPQPAVESQPQKVATPPPVTTTTGTPTEAKPAPAPSQPSMTDTMTHQATDVAKDKATGTMMGVAQPAVKSIPPTATVPTKVETPDMGHPMSAPAIRAK